MQPFREVFWNIPNHVVFYALAAAATAVCLYGVYRRYRLWSGGWPEKRGRAPNGGILLRRALANTSIFKGDVLGGLTHILIMWGFLVLFLGTVMSTIDHWIVSYLRGDLYLGYAFALDAAGAALMAGVALAYLRRYLFKRTNMVTIARDHVVLVLLFFVALSGFAVEGLRLRADPPPWPEPSPIGQWIASVTMLDAAGARFAHRVWWWVHSLASFFLIAWLPFSKFIHVLAAPLNLLYEDMESSPFLTLEEREGLTSDFSMRQRVMMDACTQCNRCTVVCPSAIAGEPLSPRVAVDQAGEYVRRTNGFGLPPARPAAGARADAVGGEVVWYCTTCSHCARECPSAISPMDIIREVRTARVESGENVPDNVQAMLESVYKFKNPWQGAKGKRMDWAAGLDVPVFADGAKEKRCFYVGCTLAYDTRLQAVPRAAVEIFAAAGFPYAVLGKEEICCGEFIRGVGEDGLFFELAGQNHDGFDRHGVEEIITPCPHGMHTFANEYRRMKPSAAGRSVLHLSQVLAELTRGGSLRLESRGERTVTFHDPCFLGRRAGVYDAPRAVLSAIPGVRLVEMRRSRERSLCCGGGGGRMWVEAGEGEKIGEVRAREAAETGAEVIVTSCPFCLTNLEDAVKTAGYEDRVVVRDLAELVSESLPGRRQS